LGETVGITGTPFSLNYSSDRVPGRTAANTLVIPLSGAAVPASLKRINLQILVTGREFDQSFPASANQSYTFSWDGKDIFGRTVQGAQAATIRVGYVYPAIYEEPDEANQSFNQVSGLPITGSEARQEITVWEEEHKSVGTWNAATQGLGGWTIDVQNAYDPNGQILYLGDGQLRSAQTINRIITTVAGGGTPSDGIGDGGPATKASLNYPWGVAVGPDGSIYVADSANDRLRRIDPTGIITTIAGTGVGGFSGDGGPATKARLSFPEGIAVGPDGSIYFGDEGNARVRKIDPDGIITTVAGGGSPADGLGDGGPATQAALRFPQGVQVASDGTIYIADYSSGAFSDRIRKVTPDGIITTVAGTGINGFSGDGGPASQAQIDGVENVGIGPDGSVFIPVASEDRIRRVGPDGIITTIAGGDNVQQGIGDGQPAVGAVLYHPQGVNAGQDGTVYISEFNGSRERAVGTDGIITTLAGNGVPGFSGDGGPATNAELNEPAAVAAAPDGTVYIADIGNNRIRKVAPPLPGFSGTDIAIPSEDGTELYQFNSAGRHLRTLNAETGALIYSFTYDSAGNVIKITDGDGLVTTIERDVAENPSAIVGPFGQQTILSLDANGYLSSIADPAGNKTRMTYAPDGLMQTFTDPNNNLHQFTFGSGGRLTKDQEPTGGFTALTRTENANGFTVTETTALGRTTADQVINLAAGGIELIDIEGDGANTTTVIGTNGTTTTTAPDGTVTKEVEAPDPRWGMQAPIVQSLTVTTPGGLTSTTTTSRTVTLSDPNNPLSLQSLTDTVTINGQVYTSTFDATTRTLTQTTPAGRKTVTQEDALGRVLSQQVAGLDPVNFTYDAQGRLIMTSQGTGASARVSTIGYDTQGNVASSNNALSQSVSFLYDAAGQLTSQKQADGGLIQYGYDANGNLTSLTPPGRTAHNFTYTPVDLVQNYAPPSVGTGNTSTAYTYNLDQQLSQVARPDGATITDNYDATGRLSTVVSPSGTESYAYDPTTGNLTTVTANDGGTLSYAYDGSLVTKETWTGTMSGTLSRTYDNNFRVTSDMVNGGAAVAYQYDQDGLLSQAGQLALTHDPGNGLVTGTTLADVGTTQGFDTFGELANFAATVSGSSVYAVQYTRDKLGRITQQTETINGQVNTFTYGYDPAGRLTDVSKNGTAIAHYDYDSNGNRLKYTGPTGTVTAGTYDAQDRLTQYGNTAYTYTPDGDLQNKTANGQTTAYSYDVFGNLSSVTLPDGTKIDYVIDGNNRRIGKKVNGTLIQGFLYDGPNIVAELDGNGNVVSRFVYGSNSHVPDYMIRGGNTFRIITDQVGSPQMVANVATGAVVQRMNYDEFGNVILDTNPGFQPFGFAGGLYDQHTSLTRFGARDYDAETGRWTTKDTLGVRSGALNTYLYAEANPLNLIDPLGLEPLTPGQLEGTLIALFSRDQVGFANALRAQLTPNTLDAAETSILVNILLRSAQAKLIPDDPRFMEALAEGDVNEALRLLTLSENLRATEQVSVDIANSPAGLLLPHKISEFVDAVYLFGILSGLTRNRRNRIAAERFLEALKQTAHKSCP